jgi:hypothetical protein
MNCPNCHSPVQPGSLSCDECGKTLTSGGRAFHIYVAIAVVGAVLLLGLTALLVTEPWEKKQDMGGQKTEEAITPRHVKENVRQVFSKSPELLGNPERYGELMDGLQAVTDAIDSIGPYIEDIDNFRDNSVWRDLSRFSADLKEINYIIDTASKLVSMSRDLIGTGVASPAQCRADVVLVAGSLS